MSCIMVNQYKSLPYKNKALPKRKTHLFFHIFVRLDIFEQSSLVTNLNRSLENSNKVF